MNKSMVAMVALTLSIANQAHAQRAGLIRGAGMVSCGEYVETHQSGRSNAAFSQWAMGYISAYNQFGLQPQVDIPDPSTIYLYADKFCKENPLSTFSGAIIAVIAESGGFRPSGMPVQKAK